jgi:hypothetical protein
VVPLVVIGCLAIVGALAYAVVIRRVEPLPLLTPRRGDLAVQP